MSERLIDKETSRALNDLARHQFITQMLADVLADMRVCEVEGWDKTEYIRILHTELDNFLRKVKK